MHNLIVSITNGAVTVTEVGLKIHGPFPMDDPTQIEKFFAEYTGGADDVDVDQDAVEPDGFSLADFVGDAMFAGIDA